MSIDNLVSFVDLPNYSDHRGNLLVVENDKSIFPFEIRRTYLIFGVPNLEVRAGHAHMNLNQLLLASSGSFTIRVNDGKDSRDFELNSPDKGLLIKPGIWRDLMNFSKHSTCLVFGDQHYDKSDYITSFQEFTLWKASQKPI